MDSKDLAWGSSAQAIEFAPHKVAGTVGVRVLLRLKAPALPCRACHLISLSLSFLTCEMGMVLALIREFGATSNRSITSKGL